MAEHLPYSHEGRIDKRFTNNQGESRNNKHTDECYPCKEKSRNRDGTQLIVRESCDGNRPCFHCCRSANSAAEAKALCTSGAPHKNTDSRDLEVSKYRERHGKKAEDLPKKRKHQDNAPDRAIPRSHSGAFEPAFGPPHYPRSYNHLGYTTRVPAYQPAYLQAPRVPSAPQRILHKIPLYDTAGRLLGYEVPSQFEAQSSQFQNPSRSSFYPQQHRSRSPTRPRDRFYGTDARSSRNSGHRGFGFSNHDGKMPFKFGERKERQEQPVQKSEGGKKTRASNVPCRNGPACAFLPDCWHSHEGDGVEKLYKTKEERVALRVEKEKAEEKKKRREQEGPEVKEEPGVKREPDIKEEPNE
ncbi:hypothetical protein LTR97_011021 [Elasticomyces elasticus]|uniref:Uncharacterized protein n=1 Tax=Elasticomyces elasticus TaxID=574655 RepID=A0AAN7W2B7_9PEZI|nr:hypothetical protein LTR97_011021 [Elasticomyces elasticus]